MVIVGFTEVVLDGPYDDCIESTWKLVHIISVIDIVNISSENCWDGKVILDLYNQHINALYRICELVEQSGGDADCTLYEDRRRSPVKNKMDQCNREDEVDDLGGGMDMLML